MLWFYNRMKLNGAEEVGVEDEMGIISAFEKNL